MTIHFNMLPKKLTIEIMLTNLTFKSSLSHLLGDY